MLTPTQLRALRFVGERTEDGQTPTLRELADMMGYSAVGSVQDLIGALVVKGYLSKSERRSARSLSLTDKSRALLGFDGDPEDVFRIPCLGQVPAGVPVEAVEDVRGHIVLSKSVLPKSARTRTREFFALRAEGDSMTGAGIFAGDWLIVKSAHVAESGRVVVARVENDATVKRLKLDPDGTGWLLPENPAFKALSSRERTFEILGEVVALQRLF